MYEKTNLKNKFLVFVIIGFLCGQFVSLLLPVSAFAQIGPPAPKPLVFYYDPSVKDKLVDFFDGKNKPSNYVAALNRSSILTKNVFGDGQEFVMKYDQGLTKDFGDDAGEPFYSQVYYCGATAVAEADGGSRLGGWKIDLNGVPDNSQQYWTITYAAGLYTRNPEIISKNYGISSAHFGSSYTKYSNNDYDVNISGSGQGPDLLKSDNFQAIPEECQPKFQGQNYIANYYGLSPELRAQYDGLVGKAQAQSEELAEETAGTNTSNCSGGGALGWIICPVSELIANFTTDIFEDVISPMLENVPISTARTGPESGGFQAWQAMRAIANALLIVSLLAVVYAQAKGGD